MEQFQTIKEQGLDKLSATDGAALDMACNLTSSQQLDAILESEAHRQLGSLYLTLRTERMLRLTTGYQGRHRSDIVEICKAPDFFGGQNR